VAQQQSKKYNYMKLSVLKEMFAIDSPVALTFTLTHTNYIAQRDEKHNQ
jgi:hypothetical protein